MSLTKDIFAGNPYFNKNIPRKKLILLLFTLILITCTIIGVALAVKSRKQNSSIIMSPAHAIAKASCSSTLYPELCYSSISQSLDDKSVNVKSTKDIILLSLHVTIEALKRNHIAIKKFIASDNSKGKLTEREKTALHDCLVTVEESVDELHAAVKDLKEYPSLKSIQQHSDDLKTLLSSAITNQETCLDGFTYNDAEKHVRKVMVGGQVLRVERLCSNSLAMICNMTDIDLENERKLNGGRNLAADKDEWPDWISMSDRKLLESPNVTTHAVVAADGSGDYKTVSEAVAAAPQKSKSRYVIRIKAGVYRENVEVPKKKTNIMFIGDGRSSTIITGDKNVQDGSTTFHSATVAAVGERFLARDITFENTAGPSKHQAVALRVGSDLSAFYRCDILAYQDTLYVHSNRHFFVQCLIVGTVDFIFGNGAAVFQDCDIHARRPDPNQRNMITAQGRTDPNQNTGIVLHRCRIGATSDLRAVQGNFSTYLGRPWKEYSRTVIMQSTISDVIHPTGWHDWNGSFALDTLFYGEYQNTGVGAETGSRVTWAGFKLINSSSEAESYTAGRFISGGNWLNSTGFPFILGM